MLLWDNEISIFYRTDKDGFLYEVENENENFKLAFLKAKNKMWGKQKR